MSCPQQLCTLILFFLPAMGLSGENLPSESSSLPEGALLRMGSTRLAHGARLTCVRFSPDDRYIGAADSDGKVHLWDVRTGELAKDLSSLKGSKLAFSPTGKTLAIGGYYNPRIALWDLQKNELIGELPQNARCLEFSTDGQMLAAAGRDGIARLWNAQSRKLLREFKGHKGGLYAVTISPDGKLLASGGGGDGTAPQHNEVRLWNIETGEELAQLEEDNGQKPDLPGWVYAIDFSADGKTLAVASPYAVRIWDVARRKQIHRLSKCSYDIAFSPTTNRFATPGGIYDPSNAQLVTKLSAEVGVYGCVCYSHDGQLLASGNKEGYVQLWNIDTGREIVHRSGHEGGIRSVDFSPDGTLAASLSRQDGTIRIWGTASGKQLRKIPVTWRGPDVWWSEEGSNLWFAPYGKEIATWTYDATLTYWELGRPKQRSLPLGKTSAIAMALSADGAQAAVVPYDGGSRSTIGIYDLDHGTLVAALEPIQNKSSSGDWVSSLAFSPDHKLLAVGVSHGDNSPEARAAPTVQLWDIGRQTQIRRLRSAMAPPGKVVFSPDGKLLATSPVRGCPLQLWRISDGSEIRNFKVEADAHGRDPSPLTFSPDGKLLAAADANRDIYVWELATGEKIKTFRGHQKAVTSIVFSPDGRSLLSGSEDTTMLLWDVSGSGRNAVLLTPAQLNEYWAALAAADADLVAAAANMLACAPQQTVDLFARRLSAGEPRNPEDLPRLIADLTSENAKAHLRAAALLKSYGDEASPVLFKALADETDVAVRSRIEEVLETIGEFPIPAETLRRSRAIRLLEQFKTEGAQAVLQKIAETDPPTTSSRDAKAALERLKQNRRAPKAKLVPQGLER